MSSSTASATSNKSVTASTSATAVEKPTVLVSGEARDSVTVQSQLATSTVAGDVTSRSNIGQVVNDLGAAHTAHSGWVEAENAKISQWGQSEIQRILAQTKGMEQQLIKGAQEKQIALDNSHKGELAKLVQKLDLQKAAELKELEDGLQRQVQGVLTTSKNDINRIETEMNNRKMELLKQSQIKSAKEIDLLSNLVVETKLVPSQSRTVIETNTNTGNVVAVATGGTIATGQASSEAISSQRIAAIPNAGELRQATDVQTGDMIRNQDGVKVGEGAIVSTMTGVTEQQRAGAVDSSRPLVNTNTTSSTSTASGINQPSTISTIGASAPAVDRSTAPVVDRSNVAVHSVKPVDSHPAATTATTTTTRTTEHVKPTTSEHIKPADNGTVRAAPLGSGPVFHDAAVDNYAKPIGAVDAAYGKDHVTGADKHQKVGLMDKVKNALTGHHSHEPKSTDATKRV